MNRLLSHWIALIKIAWPLLMSYLSIQMMDVIDTLMISSIGVLPLAAAAFSNSITSIFLLVGGGFNASVSSLASRLDLQKDQEKVAEMLNVAQMLNLGLGLLAFLALLLLRLNFSWFGQDLKVQSLASDYFFWISLSVIPAYLFQGFKNLVDGFGLTLLSSIAMIASLALNVLLNYILINGFWIVPAIGLEGAGLATFLARLVLVLAFAWYFFGKSPFKDLNFVPQKSYFAVGHFKKILGIGVPASLQYLFEIGVFSAATIMAGWIGTVELAGHQVALKIASVVFMIPLSLSYAVSIRIGSFLKHNDFGEARNAGKMSMLLIVTIMAVFGVCLWFNSVRFASYFLTVQDVVEICASLIIVASVFQIFDGTQAVAVGILRGYLDTKVPVVLTFIAYWLISLPAAYILAFNFGFGVKGIWYGLMAGLAMSSLLLNFRIYKIASPTLKNP